LQRSLGQCRPSRRGDPAVNDHGWSALKGGHHAASRRLCKRAAVKARIMGWLRHSLALPAPGGSFVTQVSKSALPGQDRRPARASGWVCIGLRGAHRSNCGCQVTLRPRSRRGGEDPRTLVSPNRSKSASGRQERVAGAAVVVQETLEKHPACGAGCFFLSFHPSSLAGERSRAHSTTQTMAP
jgi:hypothetical protein